MALVGLVRVCAKGQDVARQHDVLDPICVKVFEEHVIGKLKVEDRPGLTAALDYLRDGDMLTVQEVDRLGRNLVEGLMVLNDLFERGIAVRVVHGIATGEHTERSFVLDMGSGAGRGSPPGHQPKDAGRTGSRQAARQGRRSAASGRR